MSEMSDKKKRALTAGSWQEARGLVWRYRYRLAIGLGLMLVSRLSGLVLPWMSGYVIDEVIPGGQPGDLLLLGALGVGATVVSAVTGFGLSRVLGVAAQRAITEMRKRVMAHVSRLPVHYYDSTQTGVLISRIMTDAEGIRNLVGTGFVQLVGGTFTAVVALAWLFYLNWRLTSVTLIALIVFGSVLAVAFSRLRPVFRERGKINAEVTGRLGETLGGIRIVKAYGVERREQLVFAKGVHRLFRNVAKAVVGVSAVGSLATLIMGIIGALMIVLGGQALMDGTWTTGALVQYILFTGMVIAPVIQISSIGTQITEAFAGLDRIRENPADGDRGRGGRRARPARGAGRRGAARRRLVRVRAGRAGAQGCLAHRAAGDDDGARGLERLRQEHADQPRNGVQPAQVGLRADRRPRPGVDPPGRLPSPPGRRAPGELPLRRDDRRQPRLRQAARDRGRDPRGEPHRPLRRVHPGVPGRLRHHRRRAGREALRRAAAARGHRAGHPGRSRHPHSR